MKAGAVDVTVVDGFPRAEKLTSSEPLPPAFLVFDGRVVKPAPNDAGWERTYRDFYRSEAERFLRALNSIAPGGFIDALFGLMALEKASLFVKVPAAHPLAPEAGCPRCSRAYRFEEERANRLCAVCVLEFVGPKRDTPGAAAPTVDTTATRVEPEPANG